MTIIASDLHPQAAWSVLPVSLAETTDERVAREAAAADITTDVTTELADRIEDHTGIPAELSLGRPRYTWSQHTLRLVEADPFLPYRATRLATLVAEQEALDAAIRISVHESDLTWGDLIEVA